MGKIKFKKGEFITHINIPNSFAIYGGECLKSSTEGDKKSYYSLICYYNPQQTTKYEYGSYSIRTVFDAAVDGNDCLYTLSDADAAWWRRMNETEKNKALTMLADQKHLAYNPQTCTFRHLLQGENISFGEPKNNVNATSVHSFGGSRNFGRTNRGSNSRVILRDYDYTKVIRKTPKNYAQSKKINGFDNRMSKSLIAAAKTVNKKTASSRNAWYGPYGFTDYEGLPFDDYDYLYD
jgi:hypothetical protein